MRPVDPTEPSPELGDGTPPHGTKPASKLSPTADKQTTEPPSVIDLAQFRVSDRLPVLLEVLAEELAPFELAKLTVEPRATLPTDERLVPRAGKMSARSIIWLLFGRRR